jgi:hypothetical protein
MGHAIVRLQVFSPVVYKFGRNGVLHLIDLSICCTASSIHHSNNYYSSNTCCIILDRNRAVTNGVVSALSVMMGSVGCAGNNWWLLHIKDMELQFLQCASKRRRSESCISTKPAHNNHVQHSDNLPLAKVCCISIIASIVKCSYDNWPHITHASQQFYPPTLGLGPRAGSEYLLGTWPTECVEAKSPSPT